MAYNTEVILAHTFSHFKNAKLKKFHAKDAGWEARAHRDRQIVENRGKIKAKRYLTVDFECISAKNVYIRLCRLRHDAARTTTTRRDRIAK
jgi:hypothetical protein